MAPHADEQRKRPILRRPGRRRHRSGGPPGRGSPNRLFAAATVLILTVAGLVAAAVPAAAAAPEGVIEGHDGTRVWGWAKDVDCAGAPSIVAVHPDYNENGTVEADEPTLFVKADQFRPDGGIGNHGFDITFDFRGGTLVRVSVYGGRDAACTQDQVVPLGTFRVSAPPTGNFLDVTQDGAADVVSGWVRDPDSCPDPLAASCIPTFVHVFARQSGQADWVKIAEQKADLPRPGGLRTGFATRVSLAPDTEVKVIGIGRDAAGARDFQDVDLANSPRHYCGDGVDLTTAQAQALGQRVAAGSDSALPTRYPGVGSRYTSAVRSGSAVRPCSFVPATRSLADFQASLTPEKSAGELDRPAVNYQFVANPTPGANFGVAFGFGFGVNKGELQSYVIVRFYAQGAAPPSTFETVWSKYSVIGRTSTTLTSNFGFGGASDAFLRAALQQVGVDGTSVVGSAGVFTTPAIAVPLVSGAGALKPSVLRGGAYGITLVDNRRAIIKKGVPATSKVRINTVVANLGAPAPSRIAPAAVGGTLTLTIPIGDPEVTGAAAKLRDLIRNQLPAGVFQDPQRMSNTVALTGTRKIADNLTASPAFVRSVLLQAQTLTSEYQRALYRQFTGSFVPKLPNLSAESIGRLLFLIDRLFRRDPVPVF